MPPPSRETLERRSRSTRTRQPKDRHLPAEKNRFYNSNLPHKTIERPPNAPVAFADPDSQYRSSVSIYPDTNHLGGMPHDLHG
jgi:hypothetical protein